LHSAAWTGVCTGDSGGGGGPEAGDAAEAAEARQGGIVLFDDGRIEKFFAIGIGGRFRHGPAGLRQLGTLQNEHGSAQQDGGRRLGIILDGEKSYQSAIAELVEIVAAGEDEFAAGEIKSDGEGLAVL
jgi:hypothetical protein